jgi:UDP-N-acetylmuramyl pentapeptide phosphotransferase/UDP-N-acetylglucosamine-1-phosphate transferase
MAILVPCAAAFIISWLLTPLLRAWALRRGALDIPNERSSHRMPTPRNGGIAIVCGLMAASLWRADRTALIVLAGALASAIAAAVDEWRPVPHVLRLSLQVAIASGTAVVAGLLLKSLALPFATLAWSWLLVPLTLVWIVGVVNAYNFMDGLNGIASIEAIVCGATMALLASRHGDVAGAVLAAAVAGAAAGFLPWNLAGSIFMGDIGSATLGFTFAVTALRLTTDGVSFAAAALPLAPFLFDTAVTLVRRAFNREFLFHAHRSHFYQRLNQLGWPHGTVSLLWGALAAMCGAVALAYDGWSDALRAAALLAIVAVHAILFAIIAVRVQAPA